MLNYFYFLWFFDSFYFVIYDMVHIIDFHQFVGSVVKWLRHLAHDQHGLGSKPTHAILLCHWEKHFMALFTCLVVLASSSKLKSYLLNYKRTAISWHLQKQVEVNAYSTY